VILIAPPGRTVAHVDGAAYVVASDGTLNVPDKLVADFLRAGFAVRVSAPVTATAKRPTANLVAGQAHFDATLNKPIWRNAANTGWVDATGTSA
jgi:hypothetical protein